MMGVAAWRLGAGARGRQARGAGLPAQPRREIPKERRVEKGSYKAGGQRRRWRGWANLQPAPHGAGPGKKHRKRCSNGGIQTGRNGGGLARPPLLRRRACGGERRGRGRGSPATRWQARGRVAGCRAGTAFNTEKIRHGPAEGRRFWVWQGGPGGQRAGTYSSCGPAPAGRRGGCAAQRGRRGRRHGCTTGAQPAAAGLQNRVRVGAAGAAGPPCRWPGRAAPLLRPRLSCVIRWGWALLPGRQRQLRPAAATKPWLLAGGRCRRRCCRHRAGVLLHSLAIKVEPSRQRAAAEGAHKRGGRRGAAA